MPRLILTRRRGDRINIGDNIVVEVTEIDGNRVKIAVMAPKDVPIFRDEIDPRKNDCGRQNGETSGGG